MNQQELNQYQKEALDYFIFPEDALEFDSEEKLSKLKQVYEIKQEKFIKGESEAIDVISFNKYYEQAIPYVENIILALFIDTQEQYDMVAKIFDITKTKLSLKDIEVYLPKFIANPYSFEAIKYTTKDLFLASEITTQDQFSRLVDIYNLKEGRPVEENEYLYLLGRMDNPYLSEVAKIVTSLDILKIIHTSEQVEILKKSFSELNRLLDFSDVSRIFRDEHPIKLVLMDFYDKAISKYNKEKALITSNEEKALITSNEEKALTPVASEIVFGNKKALESFNNQLVKISSYDLLKPNIFGIAYTPVIPGYQRVSEVDFFTSFSEDTLTDVFFINNWKPISYVFQNNILVSSEVIENKLPILEEYLEPVGASLSYSKEEVEANREVEIAENVVSAEGSALSKLDDKLADATVHSTVYISPIICGNVLQGKKGYCMGSVSKNQIGGLTLSKIISVTNAAQRGNLCVAYNGVAYDTSMIVGKNGFAFSSCGKSVVGAMDSIESLTVKLEEMHVAPLQLAYVCDSTNKGFSDCLEIRKLFCNLYGVDCRDAPPFESYLVSNVTFPSADVIGTSSIEVNLIGD